MTKTVLEQQILAVREQREARKTDAAERYHKLIRESADGVEVDPAEAAVTLEDAERSPEQLEEDVQLLLKRRKWATDAKCADGADQTIAEATDAISKLVEQRDQFAREIQRKIDQHAMERAQATDLQTRAARAAAELRNTAWPHLRERERELRQTLSRFGPSLQEMDLSLKHLEGCAIVQDDYANNDNSDPHGKYVTDRVKQFASLKAQDHRREIAELKQRKLERQAEVDEILAELEEIERGKLVP